MTGILKDDLLNLKSKLESIESQLEGQLKDLEVREDKWSKMDEQVEEITKTQNDVIRLNIGGKKFATKTATLLSIKDTIFYQLILSKKIDLKQEIFFDRSPKMFNHILDFFRYQKINYKRFNREELDELYIEAEYYEIGQIADYLAERKREIEFVSFETNGTYSSGGQMAGTNNVQDLKDKSCTKGICATSPGWIIIELNNEWDFDEIELAGWGGNTNIWGASNGSNATILTSKDRYNWTTVGTIPSNYNSVIQTVKLTRSSGRYIKFQGNSYLGIGYLNIIKK
jgi:hypothetical protein